MDSLFCNLIGAAGNLTSCIKGCAGGAAGAGGGGGVGSLGNMRGITFSDGLFTGGADAGIAAGPPEDLRPNEAAGGGLSGVTCAEVGAGLAGAGLLFSGVTCDTPNAGRDGGAAGASSGSSLSDGGGGGGATTTGFGGGAGLLKGVVCAGPP